MMKIILNDKQVEIETDTNGKAHGGDVRAKLPGLQRDYMLVCETGKTDEIITDTTEVHAGDHIASVPKAFMA